MLDDNPDQGRLVTKHSPALIESLMPSLYLGPDDLFAPDGPESSGSDMNVALAQGAISIDMFDLSMLASGPADGASSFMAMSAPSASPAAVPLPSGLLLLLSGFGGFGLIRSIWTKRLFADA